MCNERIRDICTDTDMILFCSYITSNVLIEFQIFYRYNILCQCVDTVGETGGQPNVIWNINHFRILNLKIVVVRSRKFRSSVTFIISDTDIIETAVPLYSSSHVVEITVIIITRGTFRNNSNHHHHHTIYKQQQQKSDYCILVCRIIRS